MATIKDKIGLAMLPSAQSGGASTDTTDFSGTVHSLLPIQYTSANLLTNGAFDKDSGWTKGTGWSISGGKAIHTGGTASYLSQDILDPRKTYKINIEVISADASNFVQIYVGQSPASILIDSPGTYEYEFNSQSSVALGFALRGVGEVEIDNVSVQLVSNGDFDFERSSSATRVGSDGYIKNVEVLSDELVQNRDFEDIGSELAPLEAYDTNFSANPSSGTVTEENGVLTAVGATSVGTAVQITNRNITVGKIYKVSFSISNYISGNFALSVGNQYSPDSTGDGDFEYYIKYTSGIDRFYFKFNNFTGTVDNVSVKEVGENWTFGTGWNITNDGGNLKAVADNAAFGVSLTQNISFVDNTKYRVTYTISDYISGSITMNLGSGVTGATRNANGTYTEDYIHSGVNTLYVRPSTNNTSLTIDNISVVEITDDTDIPRLDYTNQACPSLLLEPQRTNLVQQSEYIPPSTQNGWQIENIDVDSSDVLSPDGKTYMRKVTSNEITSINSYVRVNGTMSAGKITASVFVKKGDYAPYFTMGLASIDNNISVWFDLDNGTILSESGTVLDKTIVSYGNGIYRVSITTESTVDLTYSWLLRMSKIDGNYQIDSGSSQYYWGAQVENGSYATSYIPTNGSSVTRLADVCNNAGDSTIFNDAEGVLFAELLIEEEIENNVNISISKGVHEEDLVKLIYIPASNIFRFQIYGGTSVSTEVDTNALSLGVYNKIAGCYDGTNIKLYINGSEIDTVSTNQLPTGLNQFNFDRADGTAPFYGNVRQLLYFNEALSDTELERLTSSDITQVLRNYNRRGELLGATYESTHVQTKLNELF